MAINVIHVIHESASEDSARLLSSLIGALPDARAHQHLVTLGRAAAGLDPELGTKVNIVHVGRRFNMVLSASLDVRRVLKKLKPDVVLAWDVASASVLGMAWSGRSPVVMTLCDPQDAPEAGKWFRVLASEAAGVCVIASSQRMHRRLIEAGVTSEKTTVIRPGVDFGTLRRDRETVTRASLGLPERGRLLLTPSPPSRQGGQFFAVWSTAILRLLWPDAVMLVPGKSREQERIQRLVDRINTPEAIRLVGDRYSPTELLAVADLLVVAAQDDIPTSWLAWAMAAGVPIVGSATYAVAELIADRHNGFLCKTAEPHTLATRIRRLFEDQEVLRQCISTARGQAYDVFRMQRCVDEYLKIIDNIVMGRNTLENIQDAAII